ncbi:serine/threonine-protein kinase [Nocardia sp. NPDC051030]|uniref:serine/threonine-protein kinase n=1 Tax=Nocardia sp. NPDC051030 TaxID=3155162 RepID=UPI0034382B11
MTDRITPGTIFAGYRIERLLGAGGMGTVYLARHPRLPRTDALKVLPEALGLETEYRARFLREAEAAARLDHPNLVAVHDRGIDHGSLWISMQFVDGIDAAELIRRHPDGVPPAQALHILREVAQGLDEAHRLGLLHRDVKPANILMQSQPDRPDRVLVTDFGIAKAAGQSTALTQTGAVLATLAYVAPEQITAGLIDHRADIYALGCTFFELLTGRKPFPRANTAAVMMAHVQDPPPRASEVNPALPQTIDSVIARAMAKQPGDRYDSAVAFAIAAAAGLAGTPDTTRVSVLHTPRMRRTKNRRRGRAVGLAALAAAVALVATGVVVLKRNSGDVASPLPSATTTVSGGALTWGNYQFIVSAFPGLLPATPISGGYQSALCRAEDEDLKPVDVNAQPPVKVQINCLGNGDPVKFFYAHCNSNRSPLSIMSWAEGETVLGDERWERASGRGRVVWGNLVWEGKQRGELQIEFDDGGRNFCEVIVNGVEGSTGTDVYERWWRNAPI